MKDTINTMLVEQIKIRLIECGIDRIDLCIDKLTKEELYHVPNKNCNSINNLILHLDGNVRQWMISNFSTHTDNRNRPEEFNTENKKSKIELKAILAALKADVLSTFEQIKNSNLEEVITVQCYEESRFSIIVHVIEHFSYHVGQITYITKMIKDIDTGYYAGQDLEKVNA